MPFTIVRADITKMRVDAIVNAANTDLLMGGGVCGAIFKAAGAQDLQAACDRLSPIQTGQAVLTPGFQLPCKYVIHAAGPIYRQWSPEQSKALLSCAYTESLRLAEEHECASIAFPLISSGIYGYPKAEALEVASEAIRAFLETSEMDIYLTVFDREAFAASRSLMGEVASYIDEHYVDSALSRYKRSQKALNRPELTEEQLDSLYLPVQFNAPEGSAAPKDLVLDLDEPFNTTLMRLIDARGMKDSEVYKKANIDRKLFSKIRTRNGYLPSKRTAISLAIALELSLEETDDLLEKLGYTLSHSQKFDVIIEYFILNGQYDVFSINEVLFQYDLPLLGAN